MDKDRFNQNGDEEVKKPKPYMLAVGLVIGGAIGYFTENLALGLLIGFFVGSMLAKPAGGNSSGFG